MVEILRIFTPFAVIYLKTVRAYNLKISFQVFWSIEDRLLAEDYLKKWYFWATHSRIKPMIEVAKTIKAHWNGILNYFDSRITNLFSAHLECLIFDLFHDAQKSNLLIYLNRNIQ
jgi:transposase